VILEGRLHPLAILVLGWRGVRVLGLVGIVSLLTSRSPVTLGLIAAALLLVVAPGAVLAWMRFTYRVADGVLEVRSGVLTRSTRTIPLDRVRGVDVTVPPLHRVAGLVQARVEDASGGEGASGLTLAAIRPADAQALRDAVLRVAPADPAAPVIDGDAPPPLARARAATLARAGATSGRYLLVPVAAVAGLLNALGDQLPGVRDGVEDAVAMTPSGAGGVALVVVAALALAVLVAAAGSLLVDGGFTLREDGDRLEARRGLLARRTVSLVRPRVLEVRTSPPWRLQRLAELRGLVGGVATGEREGRGRSTLMPADRDDRVWALARRIDPATHDGLDPHPGRGLPRRLLRACGPPAVVAAVALAAGAPELALVAAAATVVMAAVAVDRQRALGSRLAGGRLGLREGSLSRRHTVIAVDEVVAYRVRRSPGQRRAGLCTLIVDLGQGAGSRRALDADLAGATGLLRGLAPELMQPLVTGEPRPRE